MQDSVDDYSVEAVGNVRVTHRYRGLADFQFANTESSFLTKTAEHLLPMKGRYIPRFSTASQNLMLTKF